MHKNRIWICIGIVLFGLANRLSATSRPPDKKVVYKEMDDVELKLHVFLPDGHASGDQRPCSVFFFGGGWVSGKPQQFYPYCNFLKSKGWVAISAEYRVKKVHKTTPFECVADGKSAIRWVRGNAGSLGVDPNRIVAAGGSAGGHVAACTSMVPGHESEGEDLTVGSVPNAMVLFNPVLDTTERGYGMEKVGEDRKTEISPCHLVRSGLPPTLVFHGTADTTVPFENAERFVRLMKEAGNTVELVSFAGRNHGFFCRGKLKKEDMPVIYEKMHEWLNALEDRALWSGKEG